MMIRIIFFLLVVYSNCINARMYQWIDPASGATQLSGKPPMWYRSANSGPRVFVFENNRIIDDTGIVVSDTEREHLRQQALLRAEDDREQARQKLLQAKRLDAALEQKRQAETSEQVEAEPVPEESAAIEPQEQSVTQQAAPADIEKMRKIIDAWEKANTEKARGLLNAPESSSQQSVDAGGL